MFLFSVAAALPDDASPQGHTLSTWVQAGLGGFGATDVCRVLAPATCEPFIGVNLLLCYGFFFPSGLVLLLLALLAGGHLRDQVLLRAAEKG